MEEAAQGTGANQDYTVAPSGNQTNTADSDDGTDNVSFTVTGIDTANVDIALMPCEDVTRNASGATSFKDNENTDADADLEGNNLADDAAVPARFVTANGAAVPGDSEYLDNLAVVNGSVSFSIDSPQPDCVVAVIYDDPTDNDALDLDANNQPVEAEKFAVTGNVTFTAPAATTGPMDENVASVDKANNNFVGCEITANADNDTAETVDANDCDTFSYDNNDRFYIDANDDEVADAGEQATLEQFEAQLSAGDDVTGDYNANPALQSTFILEDEAPTAPTVTDQPTTGSESTSVTLEIADPSTGTPDSFRVYRATGTAADSDYPAEYTLIATVTPESDGSTTYVVNGLSPSTTYSFIATAVDDGDESGPSNESEATTAATNTTDTTRPQSVDAELTTNANFETRLDSGDVLQACFNEALRAPDAGDAVVVQDNGGDVATLTNGGNATFTIGSSTAVGDDTDTAVEDCPANRALIITVTGAVTDSNTTGDGIVGVPVTATDSSGVTDVAGNSWNIAGSADKYFDTADAVTGTDAEAAPAP